MYSATYGFLYVSGRRHVTGWWPAERRRLRVPGRPRYRDSRHRNEQTLKRVSRREEKMRPPSGSESETSFFSVLGFE